MIQRYQGLFLLLCLWLASAIAFGQVSGSIRGVVHDPDHRPVQGAEVTLKAAASDFSRTATTDSNGEFSFPAIPVGQYRVTVKSEGLSQMEQGVVVVSDSAPILHFQLALATARQSVEVSANPEA